MLIRHKLLLAAVVVSVGSVGVAAVSFSTVAKVSAKIERLHRTSQVSTEVAKLGTLLGGGTGANNPRIALQSQVQMRVLAEALGNYTVMSDPDSESAARLNQHFQAITPTVERLTRLWKEAPSQTSELLETVLTGQIQIKIERLQHEAYAQQEADLAAIQEAESRASAVLGIGLTLFAVLMFCVLGIIANAVLFPLEGLIAATRRIRLGELGYRIPRPSTDEIGQLGHAFNSMAHSLDEQAAQVTETQRRLELLLDCAGEGIYGLDQSGNTTFVNPAATAMLGYEPEELIGEQMHSTVHHTRANGEPYPREECHMFAAFTNGTVQHVVDEVLWRKDGTSFPVEYHSTPIRDGEEIRGAVVVFRDTTVAAEHHQQLEETNRQLAATNEDLEEFAYVASHDLKTPLQGIRHLANWIGEDLGDESPTEVRRNLERIEERVSTLEQLIDNLLSYSRASHGNFVIERASPAEAARQVARLVDAEQRFPVTVSGGESELDIARTPLETVLRNLIANAVAHHDRDTGEINVHIVPNGRFVLFSVEDDGPGVAPEHHQRVFKMYQSLAQGGERTRSNGMGLAVVKRLVERYGGSIDIHSNGQKRGTRFDFVWPISHVDGD